MADSRERDPLDAVDDATLAPILLNEPPHGRRPRVLDLEPMRRSAGSIRRAEPRHWFQGADAAAESTLAESTLYAASGRPIPMK